MFTWPSSPRLPLAARSRSGRDFGIALSLWLLAAGHRPPAAGWENGSKVLSRRLQGLTRSPGRTARPSRPPVADGAGGTEPGRARRRQSSGCRGPGAGVPLPSQLFSCSQGERIPPSTRSLLLFLLPFLLFFFLLSVTVVFFFFFTRRNPIFFCFFFFLPSFRATSYLSLNTTTKTMTRQSM